MLCFLPLMTRRMRWDSEGTYYIFEAIEEDGEQQLAEVEDEELLDRLAEIFEKHFEELYEGGRSGRISFPCLVRGLVYK